MQYVRNIVLEWKFSVRICESSNPATMKKVLLTLFFIQMFTNVMNSLFDVKTSKYSLVITKFNFMYNK